jgi:hypothetical protein
MSSGTSCSNFHMKQKALRGELMVRALLFDLHEYLLSGPGNVHERYERGPSRSRVRPAASSSAPD